MWTFQKQSRTTAPVLTAAYSVAGRTPREPTLYCQHPQPTKVRTNTALYFQNMSPGLPAKTSNKFKREVIYYITQYTGDGKKRLRLPTHPARYCNRLFRKVLQSPCHFQQEVGLEPSGNPFQNELSDLMMQQNCILLFYFVKSLLSILYMCNKTSLSNSHWNFDSVAINKTSIHRNTNEITEGWNTAYGDKYVTYNKQEETKKHSALAMYSEKYIWNLNIHAQLSHSIYRLAERAAVLIFHQSIFYIAISGGQGRISDKSDGNIYASFILNWVFFFSVNNSKSEKESKRIVAFSLFGQKQLREGRKEERSLLNVSSLSIASRINEGQSSRQTSIFPPQYPSLSPDWYAALAIFRACCTRNYPAYSG